MDDFNELLGRAAGWTFVSVGIDEVIPDVVLEHHGEQPIHRSPTTCYPLQDIGTAVLFVERTLDPENYLGSNGALIDRALERWRTWR